MGVITVAAVQAAPLPAAGLPVFGRSDTLTAFAEDARRVREQVNGAALLIYPEAHLFGTERCPPGEGDRLLRSAAEPLDSALIAELGSIAREIDAWLLPGSVFESGPGDEVFNTAVVFSPGGALAGSYRKIFPWRPYEWSTPGGRLVTVDVPEIGRLGLSVCYDSWFPEVGRHLAWMGADIVINIAKSTVQDRPQELVLAQANSIVNQVFTVSVNCAGPIGRGQSILVDPEGVVLQQSPDSAAGVLYQRLDLSCVDRVREVGTAGTNRMWSQFHPSDPPVELPLYAGRIDPHRWTPRPSSTNRRTRQESQDV